MVFVFDEAAAMDGLVTWAHANGIVEGIVFPAAATGDDEMEVVYFELVEGMDEFGDIFSWFDGAHVEDEIFGQGVLLSNAADGMFIGGFEVWFDTERDNGASLFINAEEFIYVVCGGLGIGNDMAGECGGTFCAEPVVGAAVGGEPLWVSEEAYVVHGDNIWDAAE